MRSVIDSNYFGDLLLCPVVTLWAAACVASVGGSGPFESNLRKFSNPMLWQITEHSSTWALLSLLKFSGVYEDRTFMDLSLLTTEKYQRSFHACWSSTHRNSWIWPTLRSNFWSLCFVFVEQFQVWTLWKHEDHLRQDLWGSQSGTFSCLFTEKSRPSRKWLLCFLKCRSVKCEL